MEKNSDIKKKNYLIISVFCSFFIILCSSVFIWQGIYLPKEPNSQKEIIFEIKKGEGGGEISFNLKNENLIRSGLLFRIYTRFKGISKKFQAGQYSLSPAMTISEIVQKFISGDVIKEKITIVEGWNLKDLANFIENKDLGSKEELFQITGYPENKSNSKDYSDSFSFLKDKPKGTNLEGYIFPDTYEIQINEESLESIIIKALQNFDKKLNLDLREEIKKQDKTIFDILIMASLIEKEVKTLEDKKLVSGILWKRLKLGKPLENCATIAYIKGEDLWRYSYEDTRIQSPYNTYLNLGLPPGPICNPGLESIKAALYPKDSEYWYWLSTPEGTTIFSKTLQEHNLAKAKYLR